MRARVASGVDDKPRARATAGGGQGWRLAAALALGLLAAVLVVGASPRAAYAQASSSLTPLSSPNGDIAMIPNAQGVERRRGYYTPTRPWWISYDDCVADDVFTFNITSRVTGDTLEIWAGSENCATNRGRTERGQCWILATQPLTTDTIEVDVPARNIVARILNTTVPPVNVSAEVCDDSTDPSGETLTLYFMVVDSGQADEYFAWNGGDGGIGFDVVGPQPPARIGVGVGERQLTISLDDVPTDPERQRYQAFCVPEGTTWDQLGLDGGAPVSGGTGGEPPFLFDVGDAGRDAGTVSGGTPGTDVSGNASLGAAPAGCFTEVLRAGQRPPPQFSCGEANAVSRTLRTGRLANDINYAVAVSGQDSLGNAGVVSEVQCGTPMALDDFYELYSNSGGPGGGGFCSVAPGRSASGALGAATVALMLAGLGWRRSRGRA